MKKDGHELLQSNHSFHILLSAETSLLFPNQTRTTYMIRALPAGILLMLASCADAECYYSNPVLDTHVEGSKLYNEELIRQMSQGRESMTYTFREYEEQGDTKYLHVDIKADQFCAAMRIKVADQCAPLQKLLELKGRGYAGAELSGLQIDVQRDSTQTEFLFKSVKEVID